MLGIWAEVGPISYREKRGLGQGVLKKKKLLTSSPPFTSADLKTKKGDAKRIGNWEEQTSQASYKAEGLL